VADEAELVVTHGNGPQIGALLRQNELAEREVPPRPMHALVAQTEGEIGYLIAQELSAALVRAKVPRIVVPLLSQIEVSPRDAAFRHPTKPVGRYYSDSEARVLRKREGWELVFDGARGGWRRVVPSPKPLRWIEADAVRSFLGTGWGRRWVPVVGGGGGIPVVRRKGGVLEGVDAVIDKDLTAAVIASALGADTLGIVTDVPAAAVGYGRPWERWLGRVTVQELAEHLRHGEFGEGSMRPKVEAGLRFLEGGGSRFLITDAPSLPRALRDEAGTRVVRT